MTVQFDENNSGGAWWLNEEQYEALVEAGWVRSGYNKRTATKKFDSLEEGIKEWEELTGENSNNVGCKCCGRPYQFWTY